MPSNSRGCATAEFDLVPIRVRALFPPAHIGCDLYLETSDRSMPQLYTLADVPPTAAELHKLLQRGYSRVYMRTQDAVNYREQLRELAQERVEMPPDIHLEIIRESVRDDFARAWKETAITGLVTASADFSQQVVDICAGESAIAPVLTSLALHDGDTFAHICNVCAYSVMLARKLGISNEQELMTIGQAALLHDLGKRWICPEILKKPGRLTTAEREQMSDHPRLGFLEICQQPGFSAEQLLMVYQHHERIDGTGYPVKLRGEEICWTAQLCSVVDVFDALTARRSYRTPSGPQEAMEIINQGIGQQFNEEYVRCWTEILDQAVLSES